VSGYPVGARLANSTGDGYWLNTVDGNTNNPETSAATPLTGWVPADSYGVTSVTGLGSSSVTLSTLQASRDRIVLTGTLTANINVIVPAWRKSWTVVNNCTGPFSVTFKTVSGTGVVIPASSQASIVGDGANIVTGSLLAANNLSDLTDKNAAIANLGLGDASGYVGRLINTRVFTSSDTYTPTPGTKRIRVTITGGGGGGGGCQASASNETFFGAGGGAGGTIISIMTLTEGSFSVVIGAGGSGGAGALNGLNGGDSSFASLIAPGGAGGGKSGVSNTNGGAGGVPNTGDIRIIGGQGGDGQSGNFSISGAGGASHWGGGGRAGTGGGISGRAYGSGGGSAYDAGYSGTSMTGGKGAAGICIIEEFA